MFVLDVQERMAAVKRPVPEINLLVQKQSRTHKDVIHREHERIKKTKVVIACQLNRIIRKKSLNL